MVARRALLIALTAFLAGCATIVSESAPSSKFKLNKWRLELPVNSLGQLSGRMNVVDPVRTVRPWFIASSDKLEFTCPAKGATSPNSESPRTELAENRHWLLEKGGKLYAALTVDALPSGSLTIGQVWNQSQALRLSVRADGTIRAAGGGISSMVVGNVPIGTPFTYHVEVKDYTLTLKINGKQVWSRDVSAWADKPMNFKVGAYCHDADGTDLNALFKVTFTDLKISH